MPSRLGGDLGHFRPAELLTILSTYSHSGALVALAGDHQTRVYFLLGKVAWVDNTADHLGAEEAMLDLLSWTEGRFDFVDDLTMPDGREPLNLDLPSLIAESLRLQSERQTILGLYPDDRITFRVADSPNDKISLTAEEFKLVFRIGSGRSLAEICEELKRPRVEVYSIIRNLETNGLIIPVPSSGAAPRAVAPAKSAAPPSSSGSSAPPRAKERVPVAEAATPAPVVPAPPAASVSRSQEPPAQSANPPAAAPAPAVPDEWETPLVASLTEEGPEGAVYPLLEDECFVGRDPSSAVAISDRGISTRHARILRTAEGFVVEDLKSRNGTFVNGEPVKEHRLLVDKDVIRFGMAVLTFHVAREVEVGSKTLFEKER